MDPQLGALAIVEEISSEVIPPRLGGTFGQSSRHEMVSDVGEGDAGFPRASGLPWVSIPKNEKAKPISKWPSAVVEKHLAER